MSSTADHLERLLARKHLTAESAVRMSGIPVARGMRILGTGCQPRRDDLIRLAAGMALTAEEADELLRTAGIAQLDRNVPRDSVIRHGLDCGTSLQRLNEELSRQGMEAVQ
jgi:hypothetical protein